MSGRFTEDQVKQFLAQGDIRTVADIQSALKDLFGQTLQAMLEGEMDNHLGYWAIGLLGYWAIGLLGYWAIRRETGKASRQRIVAMVTAAKASAVSMAR